MIFITDDSDTDMINIFNSCDSSEEIYDGCGGRNLVAILDDHNTDGWTQTSPILNIDDSLVSSARSIRSLVYNSPERFMEPYSQMNSSVPLEEIARLTSVCKT